MTQRIIILDRDGVINHDSPDYIKSPEEWLPIDGSLAAIAEMNRLGYLVFVATNQSGIGRNLFSLATLQQIHQKMESAVQAAGGRLSGIYFCPHRPDANCECRKPRPGLIRQIEQFPGVSVAGQYFVGDSTKDIQAARAAGCTPALVLTGHGNETREIVTDVATFADLADFACSLSTVN